MYLPILWASKHFSPHAKGKRITYFLWENHSQPIFTSPKVTSEVIIMLKLCLVWKFNAAGLKASFGKPKAIFFKASLKGLFRWNFFSITLFNDAILISIWSIFENRNLLFNNVRSCPSNEYKYICDHYIKANTVYGPRKNK